MANAHENAFNALKDGLIIGPEHHRFKLLSKQRDHFAGQLWLAEDISTAARTQVSVLVLWPVLAAHAESVKVIRKLSQQNRTLSHPHVAKVYGHFSWRGLEFLSLEHLDGQTLSDLFQRKQAGKLTDKQKQGLITQMAKAIARYPAPHYLLAPDCVFLNTGGGVKLFGFGWRPVIAPLADTLPSKPEYPLYQPPEAFHAHPAAEQADVFALAVMCWELYSNRHAFQVSDGEASRFQRELKALSALSKSQWEQLRQSLSPEPEERHTDSIELVRALFTETTPTDENGEIDATSLEAGADTTEAPPQATDATEAAPAATVNEAAPAEPSTALPEAATDTGKRRLSLHLPALSDRIKRMLMLGLAYGLGLISGIWLALLMYQGQLDNVSSQALAQMKANRELRAAFDSVEQERARLQQALDEASSRASEPEDSSRETEAVVSARELRASGQPAPNLTLFQDELKAGGVGPKMVVVPSGRFRMGDLHGQGDDNEYPVHDVNIAQSFALARHEVTFAEYDRFAEATGRPLPDDEGWGRGSRPVINVTWNDAKAYADWLREQTGQPYRLPTEAEWEYSARAGTETVYWWGDEMRPGYAVCDGCDPEWGGKSTAPVGSVRANPWGLFDMSGNVDEWVADCYRPDYTQAPDNGQAEQLSGCNQRVMRGGSWFDIPRLTRPASRYRHPATASRNSWGFRVALDLTTQ
ncbi:SUMF1/EgtB/PvdO family nonheme iron enzyme [Marinobacterium sp. AK62]|uniref:SUMF1/EgtB/PvdO family nonheme iron enzyme n=1 Tax=Marinobacterium alkalitolerans TaxID=1542925 RepID=A0ABS3ZBN1_9GAMM|nr:SUMF1/EgtB/PvdO family nonheme iron enzyme [Marinobacterium alkalitolerans]MBP0049113.1 SUMF1/EgtB/PvdO family nonheme iron enzyme [Marinobacterium alkalitolerans]